MIQLPQQVRVETGGPVDSTALTKDALTSDFANEYRLAPNDDDEVQLQEEANSDSGTASYDAPPIANDWQTKSSVMTSEPLMPSQQWTSQSATRTRQFLLVGFLGGTGILLAALLFIAFMRWHSSSNTTAQATNPEANAQPSMEPLNNELLDPSTTTADPKPEGQEGLKLQVDSVQAENPAQPAVDPNANVAATPTATPDQPDGTNPASVNPTDADVNPTAANPTAANAGNIGLANLDPSAQEAVKTSDLPKQLKKFEKLLMTEIEPTLPQDVEFTGPPPPTAEDLGLESVTDSMAIAPVDVSRQLQQTLHGVSLPPQPMAHLLNSWVHVSGIPISADLDALLIAGVETEKSYSYKHASDESPLKLADHLESISKKLGVSIAPVNNQFLVVGVPRDQLEARMPKSLPITDLVASDEQQAWLIATLDQLFPDHAGKWQVADGNLSVDRSQVDLVTWSWIVKLMNSWRAAIGGEVAEKITHKDLLSAFVPSAKLSALEQSLSQVTIETLPVGMLLNSICSEAKVQCWVDWPSLLANGCGPSTSEMMVTNGRPLKRSLGQLVNKYDLVLAIENERSLLLTTPVAYRANVRLFVVPSGGRTAEQWLEEIQPFTPGTTERVLQVQAIMTPDQKYVILRCCRPYIRSFF